MVPKACMMGFPSSSMGHLLLFLSILFVRQAFATTLHTSSIPTATSFTNPGEIVVVGSVNADLIIPIDKMPALGETVMSIESATKDRNSGRFIAGGKGANQAVASKRLGAQTSFVCSFGDDESAKMLEAVLDHEQIDTSMSLRSDKPSGMGLVFLQEGGAVSCVVVGGSNAAWPAEFDAVKLVEEKKDSVKCVMLQMEIPQRINEAVAVAAFEAGIPVFQDVGGAEREVSDAHLRHCLFVSPNLTELKRLARLPVSSHEEILVAARSLQQRGARNVLVTLGDQGSLLLTESGEVLVEPCCPAEAVLDETGAGDNYRAAFCVSRFVECRSLRESMAFAAAAGAVAVSKLGAIPACSTRVECEAALLRAKALGMRGGGGGRGGRNRSRIGEGPADAMGATQGLGAGRRDRVVAEGQKTGTSAGQASVRHARTFVALRGGQDADDPTAPSAVPTRAPSLTLSPSPSPPSEEEGEPDRYACPFLFASRLNSMRDRADLWAGEQDVCGWVARQGQVKGLDLVDFNFPQHIRSEEVDEKEKERLLAALKQAGLRCGAVCLRFPKEMQLGALTHPDRAMRTRAIRLTQQACAWAKALGAAEVVVWSAFCGYDYSLQVDHDELWEDTVLAFQAVCDAHPDVKISLEFKPTDENTRYFAVPSTGAAVLLTQEVSRDNFGLTLDFGHLLMAGENPAQAVSLVSGRRARRDEDKTANKLFGVQLGDGYGRLGAEDGLAFGSVHPSAALELVLWLIKTNYAGHIYFDTFPRNEDPVRECEHNIRNFKRMYRRAKQLLEKESFATAQRDHDAMTVLELLETL